MSWKWGIILFLFFPLRVIADVWPDENQSDLHIILIIHYYIKFIAKCKVGVYSCKKKSDVYS